MTRHVDGSGDEVERRYRLIREAMARDGARRGDRLRAASTPASRAPSLYLSGFAIVHRYAYVLLPLEGDPAIVFPREARYVGEHGTTWIERAGVRRPARRMARRPRARQARRRLRARLRDARARLPRARRGRRARAVGRGVRPCARGQERLRARVGPRERPHQRRGLLGVRRGVRAGQDRARDAGAVRAVLRRAGLRPPDDGHGARPARTARRCPSSRSPAHAPVRRDRHGAAVARDRRPGRPLGRGLARDLRRRAERRVEADDGGLRGVLRGRAQPRCATARRRTTSTAPSPRASSSAASRSAT